MIGSPKENAIAATSPQPKWSLHFGVAITSFTCFARKEIMYHNKLSGRSHQTRAFTTTLNCWDFGTPKVITMNVRVNLLAIFLLSICSTCAHAQFNTVINLPENPDSPNPSGFSGNSIGNNSGISSNTQLNVSDGGSIGFQFGAGARDVPSTNVEVNISGGTILTGFEANSGSTVNISGGGRK